MPAEEEQCVIRVSDTLAVVLVDMQGMYVDRLLSEVRGKIINAQKKIIEACADKDIPLIILEYNRCSDCDHEYEKTTASLSHLVELVPRTVKIKKRNKDGFEGTDLDKILKNFCAETLILMGIYANACVRKTAESALSLKKYRIITAENLIADSNLGMNGDATLREISRLWYSRHCEVFEGSLMLE